MLTININFNRIFNFTIDVLLNKIYTIEVLNKESNTTVDSLKSKILMNKLTLNYRFSTKYLKRHSKQSHIQYNENGHNKKVHYSTTKTAPNMISTLIWSS